jgi:hypothetical protein
MVKLAMKIPDGATPITTPDPDLDARAKQVMEWLGKFINTNPIPANIERFEVMIEFSDGIGLTINVATLSKLNVKGQVN